MRVPSCRLLRHGGRFRLTRDVVRSTLLRWLYGDFAEIVVFRAVRGVPWLKGCEDCSFEIQICGLSDLPTVGKNSSDVLLCLTRKLQPWNSFHRIISRAIIGSFKRMPWELNEFWIFMYTLYEIYLGIQISRLSALPTVNKNLLDVEITTLCFEQKTCNKYYLLFTYNGYQTNNSYRICIQRSKFSFLFSPHTDTNFK